MKWLIFAFVVPAFSANAEMFKCVGADGSVSFQGEPCPDSQVTERQRETDQQKRARAQREADAVKQADIQAATESWVDAELPAAAEEAVRELLKTSFKDPSSLKDFEVVETVQNDTSYRSHIRYRALNSYGAYGLDEKIAEFDLSGGLTDFRDILPYLPIQFQ